MKLLLLPLALCGCLSLPLPDAETTPAPVDYTGNVLDATVALVLEDGQPYCSGAWVRESVVTAAHCVKGVETALVAQRSEFTSEVYPYRAQSSQPFGVALYDEEQDIAVLLPLTLQPEHASLTLARKAPVRGQEVVAVGHPYGMIYSAAMGRVGHPRRVGTPSGFHAGGVWMQAFIDIGHGNSGGPLVTRDGYLVGVASFVGPNFVYAGFVHWEVLYDTLN